MQLKLASGANGPIGHFAKTKMSRSLVQESEVLGVLTPVGKEDFEPQFTELSKFWTIPCSPDKPPEGDWTL
jgi:hypothetical protein